MDARHAINCTIALLSMLLVLLAALTGWHFWLQYRQSRDAALSQVMADDFIAAAGFEELERAYGSAVLGALSAGPKAREQLKLAQGRGDLLWRRALKVANAIAQEPLTQAQLKEKILQAEASHEALLKARHALDLCLKSRHCELSNSAWQRSVTHAIRDAATVREMILLTFAVPGTRSRIYSQLRRYAWMLSERTLRQRGLTTFYLTQADSIPVSARRELARERAVAALALDNLRLIGSLPPIRQQVRTAIRLSDRAVTGQFNPLSLRVLAGTEQLTGDAWLAQTAQTATALNNLSQSLNRSLTRLSIGAMHRSRNAVDLSALLILLTGFGAFLSATKVRQTANALFHQKELAEVTIRSIGDAVITTDAQGQIQYINPVATKLTGWHNKEAIGLLLRNVFNIIDGLTLEPQKDPLELCLRENRVVSLENSTILLRRDGSRCFIEDSAAPIRDRAGKLVGAVLVFYDVAEGHHTGMLLAYRAAHDSLSGLINRRQFEHQLAALLASGKDAQGEHALLHLDLDQFKIVNEACGPLAGDHLLREVSRILREEARKEDVVARLAGDEFGLLLPYCSLEQACAIAEGLRIAIARYRLEWQGTQVNTHLSIGLVLFGDTPIAPTVLLANAASACHIAKEKGGNRIQVYDRQDLDVERRTEAIQAVIRISRALEEERFVLYCQPILPVKAGNHHVEVLIRMIEADGKLVGPSEFIPAAERYGLMPSIDRWVIREAFARFADAYASGQGEAAGILTVNLSGATLSDPSMESFLTEQLAHFKLPPQGVCFEITESAAVANLAGALTLIKSLRKLGCSFALDDFGRGMSSFLYLKQLPLDYLKIDGEFIRGMLKDPVSQAMVRAIHAVAQAMGLKTVAEWVESPALRHRIQQLGIDYMQGFEIGRPVPLGVHLGTEMPQRVERFGIK